MQRLGPRSAGVLFVAALLLRLAHVLALRGTAFGEILLGDARSYDQWAGRILAGELVGSEVFYQAPLYPYFLAGVYAVLGHDLWVARVVQSVLGALACLWIAVAGARLFTPRAGLVAGWIAALYAPSIWSDGLLQKTSLEVFLTALLALHVASGIDRPRARLAAALGACLGLLTLSRENSAILCVPLLVWLALPPGSPVERARRAGALLLAFAAVLAPVGVRNAALGGTFLPTASNAGVNFWIGNGAGADGLYRPLVVGRGHPDYERADAARIAEEAEGRSLSPAGVSRHWFARAFADAAAEPSRFARLLLHKARLLLQRKEVMDAEALEAYAERSPVLALLSPLANFGVLLPLAAFGACVSRRAGRRLWVPLACALFLAASVVLFFVVGRYRLGLLPFLVPIAGAGLVELVVLVRARRYAELALPGACAAAAAVLAWAPLEQPGDPRATTYSNLASELLRRADYAGAERWAREAVRADPASGEAVFNLALALRHLDRRAEAEERFREVLALEPAYAADALAELGALRALARDPSGAEELLRRALALDPAHPEARRYLETLERERGG